jgi:hypothetical protein
MVRLGIGPMGEEISGNGIDFCFNALQPYFNALQPYFDPVQPYVNPIQPFSQVCFNPIDLFAQHLLAFSDDIQLMLKDLRHHPDLVRDDLFESFGHHFDFLLKDFPYLLQFISIHETPAFTP